jgi:hypothetical protein
VQVRNSLPLRFSLSDPAPGALERILVSLFAAAVWAAFFWGATSSPEHVSDIDQVWHGSRALLSGLDPYAVVAVGGAFDIGFPLYYPLPALIVFVPLALLPLEVARLVFVALSTGILAYALTQDGWHRLPIFVSGAYIVAMASVQWSPLLTAAFLLPWLGPVLLLKPNIGLAIGVTSPARGLLAWTVAGGGLVVLLSLTIDPSWPGRWIDLVRTAPHFTPPVLLPGGFLVLLALLRWRRPEARLLVAMACTPHTTLTYEALPVLLVARNWKEAVLLSALSFLAMVLQAAFDSRVAATDPHVLTEFVGWVTTAGTILVALVYLPATILVLRRGNEGPLPEWVRLVAERGWRPGR